MTKHDAERWEFAVIQEGLQVAVILELGNAPEKNEFCTVILNSRSAACARPKGQRHALAIQRDRKSVV